ncbi:MAG: hypothetical protein HC924_03250 [Synechococcaceae cyanobacterium SM2_3_2]|nr:hypothetical protein [Synechococcaceae cyanobacterium SM2_3_2]
MQLYGQEHYGIPEIARQAGIPPSRVRSWVYRSRVRTVKHLDRLWIHPREVVRMLERLEDIPDQCVDRLMDIALSLTPLTTQGQ